MSCSGKVLGYYKPGGALEMELKTHPGNCSPNDNPWPGPAVDTSGIHSCTEIRNGTIHPYYGSNRPVECD
jgi:hypothetical protein